MASSSSDPGPSTSAETNQSVTKEQVEAILVLIKGVNLAQSRGAFSLEEAKLLATSQSCFIVKQDPNNPQQQNGLEQQPSGPPDFARLRM